MAWTTDRPAVRHFIPMGVENRRARFVYVSDQSGQDWLEFTIDSEWIRLWADTSWGYGQSPGCANVGVCDEVCGDYGKPNGSCRCRWWPDGGTGNFVYASPRDAAHPDLGIAYLPRRIRIKGSTPSVVHLPAGILQGRRESDCTGCATWHSTPPGETVTSSLSIWHEDSHHGFHDVILAQITAGPGAGETAIFARGYGWIGFSGLAGLHDWLKEPILSGAPVPNGIPCLQARHQRGSFCSIVDVDGAGSGGDDDSSSGGINEEDTPAPSAPVGDAVTPLADGVRTASGCVCRSGVDNVCLYGTNLADCPPTQPGGYCDPDGNGDFADARWETGYYEHIEACPDPSPAPEAPGDSNEAPAGGSSSEPGGAGAAADAATSSESSASSTSSTSSEDGVRTASGCVCRSGVDNVCLYGTNLADCPPTQPGGYCDPDGNGDFADARWETGYYEHQDSCPAAPPSSSNDAAGDSAPAPTNAGTGASSSSGALTSSGCRCRYEFDNVCLYGVDVADCPPTQPGGYCDPDGNGDFGDAQWETGYYEHQAGCTGAAS